ncbi:hypothetical protein [Sinorhizobium meliloti]|uniref:hypothetical protein n=1 Tax=Rhizobium meliloti TaxID=382 RepID=UPI000FE0D00A|nr:hypothetical protein [Sinorhizobium meliloti]RVG70924.1 hypothetical protein CN222_01950 [Sinorhizobium meliloti]
MYVEKTMTAVGVVEHYKEVNALLTEVGYSTRRRAGLLKKSAQTLKQYSVSPESSQHRLIPSKDLDMLRNTGIDMFWRAMPRFLSTWAAAEGIDGPRALPLGYDVVERENVFADSRHFFLPRAQELADETGGKVSGPRAIDRNLLPRLTGRAQLRSRWRKAVFALRKKVKPEEIISVLTEISGYCEYSVFRIGIEYHPWRIPPQEAWIVALEERTAACAS